MLSELVISTLMQGLIYTLVSFGVYITYSILDFPDLGVDGTFPLGAAVTAVALTHGVNAWATLPIAMVVGALAGLVTGLIHVRLKVRNLLAGIITMTALYSVNLLLGGSNLNVDRSTDTIFTSPLVMSLFGVLAFLLQIQELIPHRVGFVDRCGGKGQAGSGLIQKIDGLIRQIAVRDITLRQQNNAAQKRIRNCDPVELLVVMLDSLQHLYRFRHRRFIDGHRLEAALQGGVLFDIFAVLVECGGTDDLDLSAGKRRLEDICGIHASLRFAGSDNVMDLVDHKNGVSDLADLIQQTENTGLKLSSELRSGNKRRHVQEIDLLILQLIRYISCNDAESKCFCNCRFSDARFANQARVVLLAATKDLDHAHQFTLASNDAVQLSISCILCQISAVNWKEFKLFCFLLLLFVRFPLLSPRRFGARDHRMLLLSNDSGISEQLGKIDRGSAAIRGIVAVRRRIDWLQHRIQFLLHILQLLRRDPKLIHYIPDNIVNGHAHVPCALQAQSLRGLLPVFNLCNKNNCHSFLAL